MSEGHQLWQKSRRPPMDNGQNHVTHLCQSVQISNQKYKHCILGERNCKNEWCLSCTQVCSTLPGQWCVCAHTVGHRSKVISRDVSSPGVLVVTLTVSHGDYENIVFIAVLVSSFTFWIPFKEQALNVLRTKKLVKPVLVMLKLFTFVAFFGHRYKRLTKKKSLNCPRATCTESSRVIIEIFLSRWQHI